MTRQPAEVKLMAIAILNYADDEGYFYADEDLIRGSLFPKEDSTSIRRSIDELSSIGYLETFEHSTHGRIGRILSFLDHQRVDRPKGSKIKELWIRRTIDERSTLEGKGREQGKEGRESARAQDSPSAEETPANHIPELPDVLNQVGSVAYPLTKECAEAFYDAREAEGWLTPKGNPIANWRASLKSFSRIWKQNEDRERVKNKGKPEPVTRQVDTKPEPQLKL